MAEKLPNGVDELIEFLAGKARGYGNHLKWNEKACLKADMMNVPDRWLMVTPDQLRDRALLAGMRPEDADEMADYLKRRKAGRRLVPARRYRPWRFPHPVDTYPDSPHREIGASEDW